MYSGIIFLLFILIYHCKYSNYLLSFVTVIIVSCQFVCFYTQNSFSILLRKKLSVEPNNKSIIIIIIINIIIIITIIITIILLLLLLLLLLLYTATSAVLSTLLSLNKCSCYCYSKSILNQMIGLT